MCIRDRVYDIGFDLDGSVWFGTGSGACRLHEGTFQDFITAMEEAPAPGVRFRAYYSRVSGSFHLEYRLEIPSPVLARLYHMNGVLAAQWHELPASAGEHHAELSPSGNLSGSLPAGIYVIQLITGAGSGTQKLFVH